MALRVWLPLNGDLENKGISGTEITSTAFTIENNGKIGKCIKTTTSSSIDLSYNGNQINTGDLSFGGWFKINDSDITSIINNGNYTSTYKLATSNLMGNDSYGGIGLIWSTNNIYNSTFSSMSIFATLRTSTVNQSTPSISVQFNQWMHLFVTFQKSTGILSFYKDGVLIGSKTFSDFSDAVSRNLMLNYKAVYGGNAVTFNLPYYVNDVRIYDHCLSPLEVKEISQGLILHYKLDGWSGGAGENLLSKYVSPGQQNPGVTTTAGRTNYYGDYGIIIPAAENADTYFRLFLDKQLEQNVQYTISCEVSGLLSGSYYRFPLFAQNNTTMGILQLDHNGLCSLTFTMTYSTQSAVTVNGRTVYICFMDDSARSIASGQGAITIKNFKLEKGPIVTSWIPAMSELGIDTTKIPDSSGYGNNGVITGNVTIKANDSNEGRYNISTYIPLGSTDYITTKNPIGNPSDAITMSIWFKSNNTSPGNNYHEIFNHATSTQYFEFAIYNSGFFRQGMVIDGTRYVINGGSGLLDGNWHMLTATYDGTSIKRYIDGVNISSMTQTVSGVLTGANGKFLFGHYGPNTGYHAKEAYLADARIYATALSAEDIATLYHTPVQIDNLGGIHTFELIEKTPNLLNPDPREWTIETSVTCVWNEETGYFDINTNRDTSVTSRWGVYKGVPIKPNTTYLFSAEVLDNKSYIGVAGGTSSRSLPSNIISWNGEKRYYYFFTTSSSHTHAWVYLCSKPSETTAGHFKNIYLGEVGEIASIKQSGIFENEDMVEYNENGRITKSGELAGSNFIEK